MNICYFILILICSFSSDCFGARIKDIAEIRGVRTNKLLGYGLVVGLAGSGDKGLDFTQKSLNMVLKGLGVDVRTKEIETQNAAAVIVSATLPPFAGTGAELDVTVSSVGSASSLGGGTLMMTPLRGADGKVYAIAQGKISENTNQRGGGGAGRRTSVTGKIPKGGLLEREVDFDFGSLKHITLMLKNPDFTTSTRIVHKINAELGAHYASAKNPGTIEIVFPPRYSGKKVELVALIENIEVDPDSRARVVINKNTGTVIMGHQVRISPVAIAHNNLRIEIEKAPASFRRKMTGGTERELLNVPGPGDQLSVNPGGGKLEASLIYVEGDTQISDVISSLNEMGATPDDLIAILQSLRTSGALTAELVTQ